MNKLALSDDILMKIENPAQYIGGEINSVSKNLSGVKVRFAMCFPDLYEIGMSHLGLQIIYDMLNQREDTWCERVFSPWTDLEKIMKEKDIPLFALESQSNIKDFDFLGITLQYEMCYTNVLQILELSQIPVIADERTEDDPVVIGGGPCAYNPEPMAQFFDLFYIGEGETVYDRLLDLYVRCKENNLSRDDFLLASSKIEGIYVPSLYEVSYGAGGLIESFKPIRDDVPATVKRQVYMELSSAPYPKAPVIPYCRTIQDRAVLEIQRGCIRGCRFCQAGIIYRPNRERSLEFLKDAAVCILKNTGYDEISLSSLSSSDYSKLDELLTFLLKEFHDKGVNISLPSLRVDAFSLDVMNKVQDIKKSSLTFAPEAGTQRLRDVINKGITEEEILKGASQAFEGGWNKVKLYFMLGLPTETDIDIKEIAAVAERISECYYDIPKEKRFGKCQITISTSFFIPKPFTPFQWACMNTRDEYLEKTALLRTSIAEQKNKKSIRYNWHEVDLSILEGICARGDRRLARVILSAYRNGARFDSWSEQFDNVAWLKAFDECGVDPEFYIMRKRSLDETLPWDFIDIGVSKSFLKDQWLKSQSESVTPNCRVSCSGCGCQSYGGGVCFESQG